jgi:hypothetical protein
MARACLTPEQRQRICAMREANPKLKYRVLALKFGCSIPHIAAIISGSSSKPEAPAKAKPPIKPNVMPGITMAQLTARR